MQATRVNKVVRGLAAPAGLLLVLVATAAGAEPPDAVAATAAASQLVLAEVSASEVDGLVSASSVVATKASVGAVGKPVGQGDDDGAFLGQLVAQYLDRFN